MYIQPLRQFKDGDNLLSLQRDRDAWLVNSPELCFNQKVRDCELAEILRGWKPCEPWAGDVVRLKTPWRWANLPAGTIGIITGTVGVTHMTAGSIVFNASCFRGNGPIYGLGQPEHVSCCGGPGTIATDFSELVPTADAMRISCWHWRDVLDTHGVSFHVTVPIWEWSPAA